MRFWAHFWVISDSDSVKPMATGYEMCASLNLWVQNMVTFVYMAHVQNHDSEMEPGSSKKWLKSK